MERRNIFLLASFYKRFISTELVVRCCPSNKFYNKCKLRYARVTYKCKGVLQNPKMVKIQYSVEINDFKIITPFNEQSLVASVPKLVVARLFVYVLHLHLRAAATNTTTGFAI